jgi:hypothetical protein
MASAARSIMPEMGETGISGEISHLSRRGLLSAVAAVGAGTALVLPAIALASDTVRPADEWRAALLNYQRAVAASDRHYERVVAPLHDELERLPRPVANFSISYPNGGTYLIGIDPDDASQYMEEADPQIREGAARARAEWKRHAADRDRLIRDPKRAEAEQEETRLSLEAVFAEDRLFQTPAPDLAAVLTKLELLWEEDRCPPGEFQDRVLADVRRLSRFVI